MTEAEENELYEMANIYPGDSRLPMTVRVGQRGDPPPRHDLRIKVNDAR